MERRFVYENQTFVVYRNADGSTQVSGDEGETSSVTVSPITGSSYQVHTSTGSALGTAAKDGSMVWVRWQGRTYKLELDQGSKRSRTKGGGDLSSPMPGQVIKILVEVNATVDAGTPLLIVEAMKMQLEIKAPTAGVIKKFLRAEGDAIGAGELLVDLEPAE